MKLSKVDNIKHISLNSNESIFYDKVSMKKKKIKIQVEKRVNDAKKLYSLLNAKKIGSHNKEMEDTIKYVNRKINLFLKGENEKIYISVKNKDHSYTSYIKYN